MAFIIRHVSKSFRTQESTGQVPVLDQIDLEVGDGKIVGLFGPNGCGKTTLLNILAGIDVPELGAVSISQAGSHHPQVGYAFQNFQDVLLPWQSALDNVTFALRAIGVPEPDALRHTLEFLAVHHFDFPTTLYPYQLSIGQQQLVALARALIQQPTHLLLDEPFSALDHENRFRMQDLVVSLITNTAATIFVSHDADEALYVSDEVVLLSARPARVLRRFIVPFQRPRRHDLIATEEFTAMRRELVSAFLLEVPV